MSVIKQVVFPAQTGSLLLHSQDGVFLMCGYANVHIWQKEHFPAAICTFLGPICSLISQSTELSEDSLWPSMEGCQGTSGVKFFTMDWKMSFKDAKAVLLAHLKVTGITLAWSHSDLTEWNSNQISFEQRLLWTLPEHHLEEGLMTQFDRWNACRLKSTSLPVVSPKLWTWHEKVCSSSCNLSSAPSQPWRHVRGLK